NTTNSAQGRNRSHVAILNLGILKPISARRHRSSLWLWSCLPSRSMRLNLCTSRACVALAKDVAIIAGRDHEVGRVIALGLAAEGATTLSVVAPPHRRQDFEGALTLT